MQADPGAGMTAGLGAWMKNEGSVFVIAAGIPVTGDAVQAANNMPKTTTLNFLIPNSP